MKNSSRDRERRKGAGLQANQWKTVTLKKSEPDISGEKKRKKMFWGQRGVIEKFWGGSSRGRWVVYGVGGGGMEEPIAVPWRPFVQDDMRITILNHGNGFRYLKFAHNETDV
jgi:hypothetical protein